MTSKEPKWTDRPQQASHVGGGAGEICAISLRAVARYRTVATGLSGSEKATINLRSSFRQVLAGLCAGLHTIFTGASPPGNGSRLPERHPRLHDGRESWGACQDRRSRDPRSRGSRPRRRALTLSVREFDLLVALARNTGRIVSREELYRLAWGGTLRSGDRSCDVYVHKLRAKLEEALPGTQFIHTHVGFGYRLDPAPSHPFHTTATAR